jgi:hypothetical protein
MQRAASCRIIRKPGEFAGLFHLRTSGRAKTNSCYHGSKDMAREKPPTVDAAAELAQRINEALISERLVQRFVDSYVAENNRQALQVHASLYKDLLVLLQREALVAASMRALEIVCKEPHSQSGSKSKPRVMSRRDASLFRRKFLAALARQQAWTAGDALDFQRDLQLYEELIARAAATTQRSRKPFEAANHPFVDRCAFLLDSSFMEKARLAATKALTSLEELAGQIAYPQNVAEKSLPMR